MQCLNTRYSFLLISVTLVAVLLLQFEPLNDVDIYWQVKLGQLMLEQGRLLTADPFTFTHTGDPVPTIGWLAQIIFAGLYNLGSWRAVQILHVLLFAGAFAVAGASALCRSRDRSLSAVAEVARHGELWAPESSSQTGDRPGLFALAAALLLGYAAGASNSMVRPQSFAFFCFAVLLYVARSNLRFRIKIALSVPLLLVWQNTHPSLAIGVVALASLSAAAWISRVMGAVPMYIGMSAVNRSPGAPASAADARQLTLLTLLAAAAQFATPMDWHIFETSIVNASTSRDVLGVSEWMPPWDQSVRGAMLGFALAMSISIIALAKLRFRVPLADLALFTVMTLLCLQAARFVIFWAIALVPIWARWFELARPGALFAWPGHLPVRRPAAWLAAAVFSLAAMFVPSAVQAGVADQSTFSDGIAHLKQILPAGRIYNYREWGGPLVLAGHPHWQVLIDGRLYLYTQEDWRLYNDAALGRIPLDELVHRFQPDAFFLRPGFHDGLIALVRSSPGWRLDFADANCIILVKVSSRGC